jgi:hypothetical protein
MKIISNVMAVVLIAAFTACAWAFGTSILGWLLWPVWGIASRLLPSGPLPEGPWWLKVGVFLLYTFGPACVVYWIPLKLTSVCDWLERLSWGHQLFYAWAGLYALYSYGNWAASGGRPPVGLGPLVLVIWLRPVCLFWGQLARIENQRLSKPDGLSAPDITDWRRRFARSVLMELFRIGAFVVEGGRKRPRAENVFGRKSAVTGDEAGLL